MSSFPTEGHGWFSARQGERYGVFEFETLDGKKVILTEVSLEPTDEGNKWPDLEYKGLVKYDSGRKLTHGNAGKLINSDYDPMPDSFHDIDRL